MPRLRKSLISKYLRSGCQRQLALNLYTDQERSKHEMPVAIRSSANTSMTDLEQAGYEWQRQKAKELQSVCGELNVLYQEKPGSDVPERIDLGEVIESLKAGQFVVEPSFNAAGETFNNALGMNQLQDYYGETIDLASAAPDILQALPPVGALEQGVEDISTTPSPSTIEVKSDATLAQLGQNDHRVRLRVIDVKMSSEPGAHYFAEVVLYSIALAAWLHDHNLSHRFAVVAAPGVWAISYGSSEIQNLRQFHSGQGTDPTYQEVASALDKEVEVAQYEVFATRLKRLCSDDLRSATSVPWNELDWHVNYKCANCEYLGHPDVTGPKNRQSGPAHCWNLSRAHDSLDKIAGLSRAGATLLRASHPTVSKLAETNLEDPIYELSSALRAKRHIYPARAKALTNGITGPIAEAGTSASMPRWPDLHIYLFLDYDLSTALTAAFGVRAFWQEPASFRVDVPIERQILNWNQFQNTNFPGFKEVILAKKRTPECEKQALLEYLKKIREIMDRVVLADREGTGEGRRERQRERSSYQFYLWDDAQRRQFTRLVSRHLADILIDEELQGLAWLFPPPELLAHSEDASWRSPFTIVENVVNNTIAAPVAHHYTLLELAQNYRPSEFQARQTDWLYREPFSNLVPAERLYRLWEKEDHDVGCRIAGANQDKLTALSQVVRRLEQDLRATLLRTAAPFLPGHRSRDSSLPVPSELWLEFTRLNSALSDLESHTIRAMPPHEREARFKSAILTKRLEGNAKRQALQEMESATGIEASPVDSTTVYRLSDKSVHFNARPGDLGYALTPSGVPMFLYKGAFALHEAHPQLNIPSGYLRGTVADAHLTEFSIVNIDRSNGTIALKSHHQNRVSEMEQVGIAGFSKDVFLDPVHTDYMTSKIKLTLDGIGYPPSAPDDPKMKQALGALRPPPAPGGRETPASNFLWSAPDLAGEGQSLADTDEKKRLKALGVELNQSQWDAWEHSLNHQLSVIWGPPGTGKTTTLAAITVGAALKARREGRGIRILVTAGTHNAVKTLLSGISPKMKAAFQDRKYRLYRLHSPYQDPDPSMSEKEDNVVQMAVDHWNNPGPMKALIEWLEGDSEVGIVASVPSPIHNLAQNERPPTPEQTIRQWFDLIIVDEASQMDVPLVTLPMSKARTGCVFILAGDDLQLPPIHQADPPDGLVYAVGSVYEYIRYHHKVPPQTLQVNYRANGALVEFTKKAGYHTGLKSHNLDLKLRFLSGTLPTGKPGDWPGHLPWSKDLPLLLSPDEPAVCFIYHDPLASQSNKFEAETVAGLLSLLYPSLTRQLANERDGQGGYREITDETNDSQAFWQKAVGVVAPHRAQISAITSSLLKAFPVGHNPNDIRGAVDTVERFQGQQRDVIIASFGVGDPDTIESEDEFLYNLNRFNVMASRARAKLIVLVTRTLLDHLPRDSKVVQHSSLIKSFAESFCGDPREITVDGRNGTLRTGRSGH